MHNPSDIKKDYNGVLIFYFDWRNIFGRRERVTSNKHFAEFIGPVIIRPPQQVCAQFIPTLFLLIGELLESFRRISYAYLSFHLKYSVQFPWSAMDLSASHRFPLTICFVRSACNWPLYHQSFSACTAHLLIDLNTNKLVDFLTASVTNQFKMTHKTVISCLDNCKYIHVAS